VNCFIILMAKKRGTPNTHAHRHDPNARRF
jgi:hypothetical protein